MNRLVASFVVLSGGALPLLLDSALKGALLLGLAGLATSALRKASAATRHFVWLLAMAGLFVMPVLSALLPAWHVLPRWTPVAQSTLSRSEAKVTAPMVTAFTTMSDVTLRDPRPSTVAHNDIEITLRDWILIAWAGGATFLILRVFAAQWFLTRSTKACLPASDERLGATLRQIQSRLEARELIELSFDSRRTIPLAWGVFRPRLLLPAEALQWSDSDLRSVLLHEVAHIKRHDIAVQWLTQFVCAVHWFNPLVWLAARQIHVERERACDDLVLACGVRPSEYAAHLLNVATKLAPFTWMHACGVAMARSSRFEGRLVAVLDEQTNRNQVTRALAIGILALGLCVLVPVTLVRAVAEEKTRAEPPGSTESAWAGDSLLPNPTGAVTPEKNHGQTTERRGAGGEDARRIDEKVPVLGDIPILGRLFRYTSDVSSNDFVGRQIELIEKEIQLAEQQVKIVTGQYKEGRVTGDAVLQQQRELCSLERELAKLQNDSAAFEKAIRKEMDLVKTLRDANEQRVKVGTDTPGSVLGFDRELLRLERELAAGGSDRSGAKSETKRSERTQEAERELDRLRQKYTDTHPALEAARAQLDRLKQDEKRQNEAAPSDSRRKIVISAPLPALVKKVLVANGDKVKKGQRLMEFDDREERAKLAGAIAQLEVTKATLKVQEISAKSAAAEQTRAHELAEQKLISQAELAGKAQALDLAEANIEKARAEVSVAEQQVRQRQVALDMLTILAPRDGTILEINISEGEYASSTTKPLLIIGD